MLVVLMPVGCLMTPDDFPDDIFDTDQFWLTYGLDNWEMSNERQERRQRDHFDHGSRARHRLSDTESYNPEVWVDHFWLAPNDGSAPQVVDANTSQTCSTRPKATGRSTSASVWC